MKEKIAVTQENIENGIANSCKECPIALALSDHFNRECLVWADRASICIKTVKLPRSAMRFINRFDDGKSVKPFNFILLV